MAVSADGRGLVSQAGAVLLWETMRVTGLGGSLSQGLARWRAPRAVHDPGKVVADLAAAVALGGDCLADIAVLREQPELAGTVASAAEMASVIDVGRAATTAAGRDGCGAGIETAPSRRDADATRARLARESRLRGEHSCACRVVSFLWPVMAGGAWRGIALSMLAHFAATTRKMARRPSRVSLRPGTGRSKMCIKQLYVLTVRGPYIN